MRQKNGKWSIWFFFQLSLGGKEAREKNTRKKLEVGKDEFLPSRVSCRPKIGLSNDDYCGGAFQKPRLLYNFFANDLLFKSEKRDKSREGK